LKALRQEFKGDVQAYGIGGPRLAAEGQRQIVDARELLSMGFGEIIARLPKIFGALRKVESEARAERPDVAIFVDYPDFHFRLAKRLSRLGIPLVYYIPPKIWAWRKRRVRFLKRFFSRILCILPFEEDFYSRASISARYVGSPLQDELPLEATREQARAKLGLKPDELVLAVLPGSRPSELKRHSDVFLDAAVILAENLAKNGRLAPERKLQVLLPFAETSSLEAMSARVEGWKKVAGERARLLELRVSRGDSAWAMRAADVGLIKSGTSTLEAALLNLPHVIAYRPNALTCFIVLDLIRYRRPVGLSNLVAESVAGRIDDPKLRARLFTELICCDVTPEKLAEELEALFGETEKLRMVKSALELVQGAVLRNRESPSLVAAREVLGVARVSAIGDGSQ